MKDWIFVIIIIILLARLVVVETDYKKLKGEKRFTDARKKVKRMTKESRIKSQNSLLRALVDSFKNKTELAIAYLQSGDSEGALRILEEK